MAKAEIAIIGGTGFEKLLKEARQKQVKTPFGQVSALFVGKLDDRDVVFLPRHGVAHSIPPHKINYRANIYALHKAGVTRILATNAVGAINRDFKPGDIVVPHDFIDFTKQRPATFYDLNPVTHIDVSQPYCPELRASLIRDARQQELQVWENAVMACTEGPRFETPAEIEMFRRMDCDIVGMTGLPEAVLAREKEMCYASLCYVSNVAAGIEQRLTASECSKVSKLISREVEKTLSATVKTLPLKRESHHPCTDSVENARLK